MRKTLFLFQIIKDARQIFDIAEAKTRRILKDNKDRRRPREVYCKTGIGGFFNLISLRLCCDLMTGLTVEINYGTNFVPLRSPWTVILSKEV